MTNKPDDDDDMRDAMGPQWGSEPPTPAPDHKGKRTGYQPPRADAPLLTPRVDLDTPHYTPAVVPTYRDDTAHIGKLIRTMKLGDDPGETIRLADAVGRFMQKQHVVAEQHGRLLRDTDDQFTTDRDELIWVRGQLDDRAYRKLTAFCAGSLPAELAPPHIKDRNSRAMAGWAEICAILRALAKAQADWDHLVHDPVLPSEWNRAMQHFEARMRRRALAWPLSTN